MCGFHPTRESALRGFAGIWVAQCDDHLGARLSAQSNRDAGAGAHLTGLDIAKRRDQHLHDLVVDVGDGDVGRVDAGVARIGAERGGQGGA